MTTQEPKSVTECVELLNIAITHMNAVHGVLNKAKDNDREMALIWSKVHEGLHLIAGGRDKLAALLG